MRNKLGSAIFAGLPLRPGLIAEITPAIPKLSIDLFVFSHLAIVSNYVVSIFATPVASHWTVKFAAVTDWAPRSK
jgi:hypothetical protein